jgi:hypothetical protein
LNERQEAAKHRGEGDIMSSLFLTAVVLGAGVFAGAAAAQPAAGPPPAPPRVFQQAGYAEPEIGPAACKVLGAAQAQCAVPAMTAGVYLVRASGTSTAQAADAVQQLTVVAGAQSCTSTRNPDPKAPWTVGAKRTLYSGCVFTVVTDAPLAITVIYLDAKASKDPAGPQVTVTREPWTGVLNAQPISVKQQ